MYSDRKYIPQFTAYTNGKKISFMIEVEIMLMIINKGFSVGRDSISVRVTPVD